MISRRLVLCLAASSLAALAAAMPAAYAQKASGISLSQPWARATPAGARVGAAYMTIVSTGAADALLAASTPKAGRSELHNHIMKGDVMEMRKVDRIDVPAAGKAELKPSGYHLMLMELKEPLVAGETLKIELTFDKAGKMTVDVPVIAIGAQPPMAAGAAHHHH